MAHKHIDTTLSIAFYVIQSEMVSALACFAAYHLNRRCRHHLRMTHRRTGFIMKVLLLSQNCDRGENDLRNGYVGATFLAIIESEFFSSTM